MWWPTRAHISPRVSERIRRLLAQQRRYTIKYRTHERIVDLEEILNGCSAGALDERPLLERVQIEVLEGGTLADTRAC